MSADDRLSELERAVRFNARCTTAVLGLFIVITFGGAGYGWYRARQALRAENLVDLAEHHIVEGYPKLEKEIKKGVARAAPKLAGKLSRRGLTSIRKARKSVELYVERKADAGLEKGTRLSAEQFRRFLQDNRAAIEKGYEELREAPQETKQLVVGLEKHLEKGLGTDIRKNARLALGFLYLLRDKLRRLDEKDLTPQEQAERRIVALLRAAEAKHLPASEGRSE